MIRVRLFCLLVILSLLVSCAAQGDVPTPVPTPQAVQTAVAGGSVTPVDLAALGITKVITKGGGEADLFDVPGGKVIFRVKEDTILDPLDVVDLFVLTTNGQQEFGLFFKVTVQGQTGWLFEEQLSFHILKQMELAPTPERFVDPTATPTALPGEVVPTHHNKIAIKASMQLLAPNTNQPGALVVPMYQEPSFASPVVALARPGRGTSILLFRDNPGGEIIRTNLAVYHAGSWVKVRFENKIGWLEVQYLTVQ